MGNWWQDELEKEEEEEEEEVERLDPRELEQLREWVRHDKEAEE